MRDELRKTAPEPALRNVTSQMATQAQIDSETYRDWVAQLRLPAIRHRKYWEFAFIMQALEEQGMLATGKRGLGFGVGKEPLGALMVTRGCEIVASDAPTDAALAAGWGANDEHASGLAALNERQICDAETFAALASFRVIDMNHIPEDACDFDFCWSSCALEHLGSIEHGLAFIEASLSCLRPGGIAVHTTEFNLSSDAETVDHSSTVLFRRQDIDRLLGRLRDAGHHVEMNYNPGSGELDQYIDLPPFQLDPHIKLILGAFVSTSIGVLVRKSAA